jgi:hypothetical protein
VRPGDLVEEEYVARVGPTDTFPNGHVSPYVYRFADPERAFGLSEYVLLFPPEVDLKVAGNFTGLEREEWSEEGLTVVRWRAEKMSPVPPEPFAPPNQDLLPWVSYGFGVSWQDVGDAFRDRALSLLEATAELHDWAAPHLAEEDAAAAVRALVGAVCDDVEAGRSVLSLSTTPGESFSRGVGNRLGIVSSVLAEAGWEVDLVLARPSPLAGTNLTVPTLDAFSEPLLRVRLGGREVWIDLEEQHRGVDHIRPILQGGDALVLPLTRPERPVILLDPLPAFPNPELEQRVSVTAALTEEGDGRLVFEMSMRGAEAERMRQRVEGVPAERVSVVYQQLAANLFPGARDVRGSVSRARQGSTVRLEMELPGACEVWREGMICRSLALARPLVPALASLPERSFPLVLQLPILRRLELMITVPGGWVLDRPPRQLQTRWGAVNELLEREGDRVRSVLTVEFPAQTVTPEEYPDFARFCHAVDELTSRPPVLRPSQR